jgi:hypothetical protein
MFRPTYPDRIPALISAWTAMSVSRRSMASFRDTLPDRVTARVPSSGENGNTPTLCSREAATKSHRA